MAMGATRLVTRCPACRTAFRVVADQLRLRQGLVRCGHCDTVFDARDHLIEVPVTPADGHKAAAPATPAASSAPASTPAVAPPAASPPFPPSPSTHATAIAAAASPRTAPPAPDDDEDTQQRLPVWSRELEAGYDVPALDAPTVMLFDDADMPTRQPVPTPADDETVDVPSARDGEAPVVRPEAGDAEDEDEGHGGADAHSDEPVATFVPGVIEDDSDDHRNEERKHNGVGERDDDRNDNPAPTDEAAGPAVGTTPPAVSAPPVAHNASGYLRAPAQDTVLDTDHAGPAAGSTAAAVAREQTTRKWVRPDAPADPASASGRFAAARFSPNFLRHGHPRADGTGAAKPASPAARARRRAIALRAVLALLVLAAMLLGVYLARGELAGRFPALRPLLETACAPLGCEVPPWRDIDALRIESSQLQKQDEDGDEYQLSVALRNHGAATVALPAIELVLTDLQDQLLLRRVLQPGDYLQPSERALARQGLAANTELPVRVRFRTPDTAANYRVLIYYP